MVVSKVFYMLVVRISREPSCSILPKTKVLSSRSTSKLVFIVCIEPKLLEIMFLYFIDCEVTIMKNVIPATLLVFFTLVGFSLYFLYQLCVFTVNVMVYSL
jgi:hypothetical protein